MQKKIKAYLTRKLNDFLLYNFLKKFKNKHKGETCYIFGDGPSVKWFDIKEFSDLKSISVNWFIFHKHFRHLNVGYCTLAEPWILTSRHLRPQRKNIDGLKEIIKEYRTFIKQYQDIEFFVHFTNMLYTTNTRLNILPRTLKISTNLENLSGDQSNFFKGSFQISLSLAYLLGFSHVILVGFDAYTIRPVRHRHWYEHGEGEIKEWQDDITNFLQHLSQEIKISAISKNESDQPKCREIELITYKEYTGKNPEYKENTELLLDTHQQKLSTYAGYHIFP